MRILLAIPRPKEAFRPFGPALGLCYLSSYAKSKGYSDIKGIDMNVDSEEDLKKEIKISNLIGIYCSTKSFDESMQIAQLAKQAGLTVVMGGPHPTLCPEEILKSDNVDFAVLGEGEVAFFELIECINKNMMEGLTKIDGIAYKSGGGTIIQAKTKWVENLDDLPFPDRSIFNLEAYKSRHLTIAASRGCIYKCINCQPALSKVGGKFRYRSIDNVILEIKEIKSKYHINMLAFVDNDLTISRQWIKDFCNKIIEEKLDITWECQGRANTLNEEILGLMKKAGCSSVGIGVESGSENIINRVLHKGINLEATKKLVRDAQDVGLPIHTFFMIGIPGETKEDIEKTIQYASELNPASVGFSIATPWPETGYYHLAKEKGWMLANSWGDYHEKRYCKLKTDSFTPEEVEAYREKIFEIFKKKGWLCYDNTFSFFNPYYDKSLFKSSVKRIMFKFLSADQIRLILRKLKIRSN